MISSRLSRTSLFCLALPLFLLVLGSTNAFADSTTIILSDLEPGLTTPFSGPYAQVDLTLNANNQIDVSINSLTVWFLYSPFLDDGMFNFTVVGSTNGLAVTNLSINADLLSLGDNEFGIVSTLGQRYQSISFTVSRTGNFSSVDDILGSDLSAYVIDDDCQQTGNHNGNNVPCKAKGKNKSSGGGTEVPEPTSVLGLGFGLLILSLATRRFKRVRG